MRLAEFGFTVDDSLIFADPSRLQISLCRRSVQNSNTALRTHCAKERVRHSVDAFVGYAAPTGMCHIRSVPELIFTGMRKTTSASTGKPVVLILMGLFVSRRSRTGPSRGRSMTLPQVEKVSGRERSCPSD